MEETLPPSQTPIPPVQTPLVQPPNPPKRFPLRWILIGVIIAVISSAGAFFAVKYQSSRQISSQSNQVFLSPTPTPALEKIADWKIYKDTDNGFRFKYPVGWVVIPANLRGLIGKVSLEIRNQNNESIIEIFDFKPGLAGAIPCGEKGCESLTVDGIKLVIWVTETTGSFIITGNFGLEVRLNKVNQMNKLMFRQFLSTFEFQKENSVGDLPE